MSNHPVIDGAIEDFRKCLNDGIDPHTGEPLTDETKEQWEKLMDSPEHKALEKMVRDIEAGIKKTSEESTDEADKKFYSRFPVRQCHHMAVDDIRVRIRRGESFDKNLDYLRDLASRIERTLKGVKHMVCPVQIEGQEEKEISAKIAEITLGDIRLDIRLYEAYQKGNA